MRHMPNMNPIRLKNLRMHIQIHRKEMSFHGIFIDFITHAPLFRGGADDVYESPLGDSCFGNEYS